MINEPEETGQDQETDEEPKESEESSEDRPDPNVQPPTFDYVQEEVDPSKIRRRNPSPREER